jgi:L-asparagine transporter-like permease
MHLVFIADGLALAGNAPRIFLKTTKRGLPWLAIITCALFTTLAFMVNDFKSSSHLLTNFTQSVNNGAGTVFGWFQNMTCSLPFSGISIPILMPCTNSYRGLDDVIIIMTVCNIMQLTGPL